jgi:CheY-like chemotaxis protein
VNPNETGSIAHRASENAAQPHAQATALRILIVDDAEDCRDVFATLVRLWGHLARTSANGSEALAAMEEFEPDVILLDIGMPEMDGYELCRRLRHTRRGAHARIYAVTGFDTDAHRRHYEAAGFDGRLLKPVDADALVRILGGDSSARDPRE